VLVGRMAQEQNSSLIMPSHPAWKPFLRTPNRKVWTRPSTFQKPGAPVVSPQ
jgi:hypothetical protein